MHSSRASLIRNPLKSPSIEKIAEGLNARGSTGKYRAACPAHNGDNPTTLSITEAENGNVLVHCFRGCTQEEVISSLRDLGLWPSKRHTKSPRSYCGVRELSKGELDYMKAFVSLFEASGDCFKPQRDIQQYHRFKARLALGGHAC